jgi:hypothetical protein
MNEQVEKKQPVQNLERISERKFQSYEAASAAKAILTVQPMTEATKQLVAQLAKAKIFARWDGTFDLVFYKKIQKAPEKKLLKIDVGSLPPGEAKEFVENVKKALHGQKSKDRKKSPKKPR